MVLKICIQIVAQHGLQGNIKGILPARKLGILSAWRHVLYYIISCSQQSSLQKICKVLKTLIVG